MLEASGRGGNSAFIHHNAKGFREVRKTPVLDISSGAGALAWVFC